MTHPRARKASAKRECSGLRSYRNFHESTPTKDKEFNFDWWIICKDLTSVWVLWSEKIRYILEAVACIVSKKKVFCNILNDQGSGSFRTNLESFRTFRCPLFYRPVTGIKMFFVKWEFSLHYKILKNCVPKCPHSEAKHKQLFWDWVISLSKVIFESCVTYTEFLFNTYLLISSHLFITTW